MRKDVSAAAFSQHARLQMTRRGIKEAEVRAVLRRPESIQEVRSGRVVAQGLDKSGMLLRIVVEIAAEPPLIITVYRTSKLAKYRSPT